MLGKPIKTNIESLRLDRFFKSDMAQIAEWVSDYETTKWLDFTYGVSVEQVEEWYNKTTKESLQYYWGIYYKDKLIGVAGLIYLRTVTRKSEIGIIIGDKSVYGKGIGTEVVRCLTEYAFNELNVECMHYTASTENIGSIKCAIKNGYTKCGEFPNHFYHNGKYYSLWLSYKFREK